MAPVCDEAAFDAASVRPALITIIGLLNATSRAAERKERASATDSMHPGIRPLRRDRASSSTRPLAGPAPFESRASSLTCSSLSFSVPRCDPVSRLRGGRSRFLPRLRWGFSQENLERRLVKLGGHMGGIDLDRKVEGMEDHFSSRM